MAKDIHCQLRELIKLLLLKNYMEFAYLYTTCETILFTSKMPISILFENCQTMRYHLPTGAEPSQCAQTTFTEMCCFLSAVR